MKFDDVERKDKFFNSLHLYKDQKIKGLQEFRRIDRTENYNNTKHINKELYLNYHTKREIKENHE